MTQSITKQRQAELLKEYIRRIPLNMPDTKRPVVIAMVGLVGAGKSTLAKGIAKRMGLYIASNDAIRRFLNDNGAPGDAPLQDIVQYIALGSTAHLLEHRVSHIIDNDLLKHHEQARVAIEARDFAFYLIDVKSPESIILQRLEKREGLIAKGMDDSFSRAGLEEYKTRKLIHAEMAKPRFDFVIHTDRPLELQIDAFMAFLEDEKVV